MTTTIKATKTFVKNGILYRAIIADGKLISVEPVVLEDGPTPHVPTRAFVGKAA